MMYKSATIFLTMVLIFVCVEIGKAQCMGTAFKYQGRLMEGGTAAEGEYDFEFKLYDDPNIVEGVQVGSTIIKEDVKVYGGYFTVALDFGSMVFNGEARWLEIRIRPHVSTNPGDFVTLDPRQKLTPSPYSLHAASAKTVQVPLELSGAYASPEAVIKADNSDVTGRAIYGENTTSGNYGYLGGNLVGVQGGGNLAGVRGLSDSGSGVWGKSNSGTGVYGEQFNSGNYGLLGTSDYGVYGSSSMGYAGYFEGRGYFSSNVGVGTTSPDSKLHVNGAIRLGGGGRNFEIMEVSPSDPDGWASYIDYAGIGIGSNDGNNRQMAMFTDGANDQNIFTVATSQNNSATWEADFVMQQNGNIGVGTANPACKLDVVGNLSLSKNSGVLMLRTPTRNDPTRYSIRFQNNYIAPILGDDTQDQYFSFLTDFTKARTYNAHLRVHGQAADTWGAYVELTHDGTDGKIITDQGDIVLEPENNVGIGTATPREKLEVAGNVHIEGNLTWQTKTGYLSIPAAAFQPEEDGYNYEYTGSGIKNLSGSSQYYRGPVQLPHGAKFISIKFGWYDVSASRDMYVQLWRFENFSGGYSEGFVYSTGSAGHGQSSLDMSGDNLVVDNSQNIYDLRCYLPDSDFKFDGVIIEYTFTETY